MATLLDIAGKPLPPRNRAKRRLQQQDLRDLTKIRVAASARARVNIRHGLLSKHLDNRNRDG